MIKKIQKVKTLKLKSRVTVHSESCDVCRATIDESNWFLIATYGRVIYHLHDNDVCIAVLRVELGLCKPNFFSSMRYSIR